MKRTPHTYNSEQAKRHREYREKYSSYYTRATYAGVVVQAAILMAGILPIASSIAANPTPYKKLLLFAFMIVGTATVHFFRLFIYVFFYRMTDRYLDKKHGHTGNQ